VTHQMFCFRLGEVSQNSRAPHRTVQPRVCGECLQGSSFVKSQCGFKPRVFEKCGVSHTNRERAGATQNKNLCTLLHTWAVRKVFPQEKNKAYMTPSATIPPL